jgi:hypothetical protein
VPHAAHGHARFVKRRLMLLMLKLAIFIGSGAREHIDFSAKAVDSTSSQSVPYGERHRPRETLIEANNLRR